MPIFCSIFKEALQSDKPYGLDQSSAASPILHMAMTLLGFFLRPCGEAPKA
jgi:hypothetical protein